MRTDTHKPSVINPAEYKYVLSRYYGLDRDTLMAFEDDHRYFSKMVESKEMVLDTDWKSATCSCCGHNLMYSGVYLHTPTGKAVQFGRDCAAKIDLGDINRFRNDVASRMERKGYAALANQLDELGLDGMALVRIALSNQGMTDFADKATSAGLVGLTAANAYKGNEGAILMLKTRIIESYYTFRNILDKGAKYGISEKQSDFLVKLIEILSQDFQSKVTEIQEAEANRADLVEGRYETEATILTIKDQETPYGWTTKCLIELVGGAKAWGTLPSGASGAEKGSRLKITAAFSKSNNDPKFGFYSRPKATLI